MLKPFFRPSGAEEAVLRRDLPASEGCPHAAAFSPPKGSQAKLRFPRRRGEEVQRCLLCAVRGAQTQRDLPPALQSWARLHSSAPEGGSEAGGALGLAAPPPRETLQQRRPPHPAQIAAVRRTLLFLHYAPQKSKKRVRATPLLPQYHQSATSIEDAFFSGSGLADIKHFTVHVELCLFFFFCFSSFSSLFI